MRTFWEAMNVLLLLMLSSASQVFGFVFQLPKFGGCQDLAAQQHILSNFDKFLDKWYVQSSMNTEILQGKGRCMSAKYVYNPLENNVLVQTEQLNEDNLSWETLEATAVPKNVTNDEGKFDVSFTVPIFGKMSGTYTVLSTDYDTYSVVHGCGSLMFGLLHYDCSWLMSRKKTLTPEEEEEYYKKTDQVLENYDSVDPKEFKKVDQSNCERDSA